MSRPLLTALPPAPSHLLGVAHTGMTTSAYLMGNIDEALAYLEIQLASTAPHNPAFAWLLQSQAFLFWLHGDLTRLHQAATRLRQVSEAMELADQEALAHFLLGAVHYCRNELDIARAYLQCAHGARFIMRLMWWGRAAGLPPP